MEVRETTSYTCASCTEASLLYNQSTGQCDTCNEFHPDWNWGTNQCDFEYAVASQCTVTDLYYNPLTKECDLCSPASANYDAASGQCLNIEAVEFMVTDYERDKLGRIIRKTESIEGETVEYDYRYDVLGRLTHVDVDGVQQSSWQYDGNGDRTHENEVEVASYDGQDRLLTYNGMSYEYTANEELSKKTLSDGSSINFTYDVFSNLQRVERADGRVIEYLVDAQQRRVGKKIDGALVSGYLYQDQLNPIAELDGNGDVVSRFVYGEKINVPDYFVRGGKNYRIISDHLGSPRIVVDLTDGSVVQRLDYDVWGQVTRDTNPGFQPFGFAGGLYDSDTGLVRFGARDYDAQTGRWTAKDPIDLGGGLNVYGYAANDPINFVDSSGKVPVPVITGAIGGVVGGLIGGVSSAITASSNGDGWQSVMAAGVGGALEGALTGAVTGALGGIGAGSVSLSGGLVTALNTQVRGGTISATFSSSVASLVAGSFDGLWGVANALDLETRMDSTKCW